MADNRVEQAPFRTSVWNMYAGTPIDVSEPYLRKSLDWGTQLFIVCEASGADRDRLFERNGLETVAFRQFRIAWDPKRFRLIKAWHAKLSTSFFFEKDGSTKIWSMGQAALLEDLVTGLTLEVWSYHTPAHVQKNQSEPGYPMRRYKALLETMEYLGKRAEETEADGFISGGDDNWDEDGTPSKKGIQTVDVDPILLGELTGLRQIQGGDPTFGPREIDDYRVRFLSLGGAVKPTGEVRVRPGGGTERPQHQIHEREWVMLAEPTPLLSLRKVALQVIAGEWGNGEERRTRLTEAGYDYDAVQAKIVKILTPPPPEPVEHPCLACGVMHFGVLTESSR